MILQRQVFMNIKIAKKIVFGCILVGMACFLSATEVTHKDMPPLEKSFIKIMSKAANEYISTINEAKKTKIGFDLKKSSSDLLKDRIAKDWVGDVVSIHDYDGSARILIGLSIRPGKNVALATGTDNKLDLHTDIGFGSDLYNAVSELEVGDKVVFSGRFVSPWPDALIVELLEVDGEGLGVGFFKFTDIKKINGVKKSK